MAQKYRKANNHAGLGLAKLIELNSCFSEEQDNINHILEILIKE